MSFLRFCIICLFLLLMGSSQALAQVKSIQLGMENPEVLALFAQDTAGLEHISHSVQVIPQMRLRKYTVEDQHLDQYRMRAIVTLSKERVHSIERQHIGISNVFQETMKSYFLELVSYYQACPEYVHKPGMAQAELMEYAQYHPVAEAFTNSEEDQLYLFLYYHTDEGTVFATVERSLE